MLAKLSVLAFLTMVAALAGLALTDNLFSSSPVVIAVQAGSFAVMIWARLTFGSRSFHAAANPTEGGLVTTGPYRFVRHPIYASMCWIGWAGALAHRNPVAFALAALMTAGGLVRMLSEERLLVARYPEYEAYARRTKRLIPFVI